MSSYTATAGTDRPNRKRKEEEAGPVSLPKVHDRGGCGHVLCRWLNEMTSKLLPDPVPPPGPPEQPETVPKGQTTADRGPHSGSLPHTFWGCRSSDAHRNVWAARKATATYV